MEKKNILHINSKALSILKLSLSEEPIISKNIENFIEGIIYKETTLGAGNQIGIWKVNNKETKVIYNLNKIKVKDDRNAVFIGFDFLKDLVSITKDYEDKRQINFKHIIGNSPAIIKAINKAKISAKTDSSILLLGDTGTGKELFARSIHNESLRQDGNFIAINCASIPDNLIESELFGYEKGSFTGASLSGKKGKIELADNGTLFLDEIGDLPIHLQTKLLRVLQERSIDKIGADRPVDVNIRIISATSKNLVQLIREGNFRLDLYYRLNIIPINLPNLRNRQEDILLCSNYIIDKLSNKMGLSNKKLSPSVIEAFKSYPWYGNIRELENVLEHGICFSSGDYIELDHLPDYFLNNEFRHYSLNEDNFLDTHNQYKSLKEIMESYEKQVLTNLIKANDDKKALASQLDIGLATLYRKIDYYQI